MSEDFETVEWIQHTVFHVRINRRVQKELGLSDDDVSRLLGRPRYKKGWSTPGKSVSKSKQKVSSKKSRSEDQYSSKAGTKQL